MWNDCITPVDAYLNLRDNYTHSSLYESAEQNEVWGRHSFIGLGNLVTIEKKANEVIISHGKTTDIYPGQDPTKALEHVFKELGNQDNLPPALGYLSYDIIKLYEEIKDSPKDSLGIADSFLILPEVILSFDHFAQNLTIAVYSLDKKNNERLTSKVNKILAILSKPVDNLSGRLKKINLSASDDLKFTSNITKANFLKNIEIAKQHIIEGDIFQVVLSQRWQCEYTKDPFLVYRSLRHVNPSPYLFFLAYPKFSIAGSSPEVLVKKTGPKLLSRPIAGTRPRGATEQEDAKLAQELLKDEKELAEHKMLVDLARNDLGRISEFGSIKITKYLSIENYSHVKHIVSTIEGKSLPNLSFSDLIKAVFPAGTLSGAPKIRAMQIIAALETEKRCFYGGGVCKVTANGDLDACIAIRSAIFKDNKAYIQAGGGIVADSIGEFEYNESVNKAKAVFKAIQYANSFENY